MRLMERLIAPTKDCISFPDLLIGLSNMNNEPLSDVVYYLSCCDLELLNVYQININHKVEIAPFPTQELTHYFLENVLVGISCADKEWVFTGSIDNFELLSTESAEELEGLFDAHADYYFKVSELLSFAPLDGYLGFLEPGTVSEEATSPQGNNSLASYMAEYTLPQVVALILHIDLADITTTPNNSYIHNQNDYAESVYHKFANLLQSYSVAALNNKLAGVDLHTRTVTPYLGDTETYVNLEKTSISRTNLASYLTSIGYELADLIAKQESTHTQCVPYDNPQQQDSELVLSLKKQVSSLQDQVDEKDKELKAKSIKLDLALKKIKEASEPIGNGEQLTDNTANDYQVTIGVLLELLRTPKGCDKEGKPNRPLFLTQNDIVTAITDQLIPNHGKTKVSERFTASNYALSEVKKKRDSDLEEKLALAERIKKNSLLSS